MTRRFGSRLRSAASGAVTVLLLVGVLVPVGSILAATGDELYMTEYVEGSGANQAIELYNPTDNPISLGGSGYLLAFYFNGDTTIDSGVPLVGTIQAGHTWVVTPTDASAELLAKASQKVATSWFDGNDAVALLHMGTAVDVIGQIGSDPGAGGWGSGATTTTNHTLRRHTTVTVGDMDGTNAFDPALEWDGYPVDTFGGLGTYPDPLPNQPIAATCPGPISTTQGTAASAGVSATDPDGVVGTLTVTAVTPTDPGSMSVTGVTPAPGNGGIATGTLMVGASTPAGGYTVTVTATNQDAAPQSASCDVAVTVDAAPPPPPPPPSLDTLRSLVDDLVQAGDVSHAKAFLLSDRLDRAAAALADGRTDAYLAQLRALANQAEGLAPRWMTEAAADRVKAAAEELAAAG